MFKASINLLRYQPKKPLTSISCRFMVTIPGKLYSINSFLLNRTLTATTNRFTPRKKVEKQCKL